MKGSNFNFEILMKAYEIALRNLQVTSAWVQALKNREPEEGSGQA